MKLKSFGTVVALACILAGCGPGESGNNKSNANNANNANNQNNGPTDSIREILPDGYDRVEAGRFSPDGSRLAMVATPPGDSAEAQLITTNLEGGDIEVLVSEGLSYLTTIAWMPDGESVVYGGGGGIMQVETDGSNPTLLVGTFAVESVDLSPDGANVTWSINGSTTITTAPVSADPGSTDEHIAGPMGDMPRFSLDGEKIAFVSSDGVAVSAPDGADVQIIEAATHFFSNVAWRNADTIVALTDYGVTFVDVASGESTDVHEEFAALGLDVSPDGSMFLLRINGQKTLRLGEF